MSNRREAKKKREERAQRAQERTEHNAQNKEDRGGYNCIKLPDNVTAFTLKKDDKSPTKYLDIAPFITSMGISDLRIPPDDMYWRRPFAVHKNIGLNNDTVLCLKTIGEACPICEEIDPLWVDYEANKAEIDLHRAKNRDLYLVRDRDDEDGKWQVWDISYHLFTDLFLDELKADEEKSNFFLPGGCTVKVRFKQKTHKTFKFHETSKIEFVEREGDDYEEGIEENTPCLDDCLVAMDYDELEALFHGKAPDEQPEDEETEPDNEPEEQNPDPVDNTIEVGCSVLYQDELVPCEVVVINGDEITIKDKEGDEYPATLKDLTLVEKESEKPESTSSGSRGQSGSGRRSNSGANKCPNGHEFGKDTDDHKDCSADSCPEDIWTECDKIKNG